MSKDSVRAFEAGVSVMYLCASSTARTFPTVGLESKYILRPILKSTHAVLASTNGHERSRIVIVPGEKVGDFVVFFRSRNDSSKLSRWLRNSRCLESKSVASTDRRKKL